MKNFYNNKNVLVTGHTGFKGTWLCQVLLNMGANVIGYGLEPPTQPDLFSVSGIEQHPNLKSVIGDIRDFDRLKAVFTSEKPEIVIHLAAQPIVRESYKDPVNTYSTNVMGTVNILECVRTTFDPKGNPVVRSFLNVTTDKVYKNKEWCWGYRENEPLDGFDPYSNSKSCSELVTHAYKDSFFQDKNVCISTARAGNVVGGGDFANDRIIPDCIKALKEAVNNHEAEAVAGVRNPYSIRPYQHVLEPLTAYLMIAMKQYDHEQYEGYYNVGPDDCDCVATGDLVSMFCRKWNDAVKSGGECKRKLPSLRWTNMSENDAPHEAGYLKLDCSKLKSTFDWRPRWNIESCIEKTVDFYKVWLEYGECCGYAEIQDEMNRQIDEYLNIDL